MEWINISKLAGKLKSSLIFTVLHAFVFLSLIQATFASQPLCISLGPSCGPALALRDVGLRFEAYPFDWLLGNFDALYQAIEDDFTFFFSDLKRRQDVIGPDYFGYIDYYGFHFVHEWPKDILSYEELLKLDFSGDYDLSFAPEAIFPAIKEKYLRRIERFRKACLSTEKVFFIIESESPEELVKLRDLLIRKYPALDFLLIVLTHHRGQWDIARVAKVMLPSGQYWKIWGLYIKSVIAQSESFRSLNF